MSSGVKTRGSKKKESDQKSEEKVQIIENEIREQQVEHLKTVVKTLASNFSEVKRSAERARGQSVPELEKTTLTEAERENLDLKEQVGGLKQEFASLKSELSEVTQLLKMLLVESPREGTVQMMTSKISSKVESSRNPDIEMAQSFTSQRIHKTTKLQAQEQALSIGNKVSKEKVMIAL